MKHSRAGWGLAACLMMAGCAAPPPPAPSHRIVSTNPCLDAILVELAPPDRIAAISHYSQDPRASSMPIALARRFRATNGTAEEVIALKPGLVLASSFTSSATLAAYRRLGLSVATFGTASTIEENRAQIRQIAQAIGEQIRGEALIARIDRAVEAATPPNNARPSALLWIGGSNLVNGQGTLVDDMLVHAGFRNASSDYGVRHTGVLPLEFVVRQPPQVVLTPKAPEGVDTESRRVDMRIRALGVAGRETVIGDFPASLFFCGGPTIIPAMERLAMIRGRVAS